MTLKSDVRLKFLGAAGTVTGSRYLLTVQSKKILIDCGLFQGLKELRLKNWEPSPVDASTLDAVVLTHAHIDHSGYIPRLIKEGFRGKVYCTPGTLALCRVLLPDTGYLQEEEAEFLNRKKISKHSPALPLFTYKDAEAALKHFEPRNFHEDFNVCEGIRVRFLYAGHILGAAMAMIQAGGIRLGFSGDVGRLNDPVMKAPENLPPLDYLVVESTYGNRLHPATDPKAELADAINAAVSRRGVVLIPAFTVGRAQTLLHFLAELRRENKIPDIPMYLNSPMATKVTAAFFDFQSLHKLTDAQCLAVRDVVRYVDTADESKKLNSRNGPMVIISASGMATGGRILHHLKAFAPGAENLILLSGFQAAGTRGEALQRGVKEIKIHGQMWPVNAEVRTIENLSAHADSGEILRWLSGSHLSPRQVFVTHGEPAAARALSESIHEKLGWQTTVPAQDSEYTLESK